MTFCTDVDLLHWEPRLLTEAAFASQTLISGTGDVAGTTFTCDALVPSLIDCHVEPHHVLCLGPGGVTGCFPIVSVDGDDTLTVSVLYDPLYPVTGDPIVPTPVGTAANVPFVVRTYWPQRRVVSDLLLQSAGVDPHRVAENPGVLLNPGCLRRACTLGTLQMIYSTLAAASATPEVYTTRADLYERLYRRAMRSARIELDLDNDGQTDATRQLNVLHLQRV